MSGLAVVSGVWGMGKTNKTMRVSLFSLLTVRDVSTLTAGPNDLTDVMSTKHGHAPLLSLPLPSVWGFVHRDGP